MESLSISPSQAGLAMRALKMVATADGRFDEWEALSLTVAARALGVSEDLSAWHPVTPEEIAAEAPDPLTRERLIQAMITISLMDGAPSPNEIALIEGFGAALGVSEPRFHNLHQLADGRMKMVWLSLARRSFARREFEEALHEEGVRGIWKIVGPLLGMAEDPALAARYEALRELPAGTLGRTYYEFVRSRGFQFPGEKGGIPERGVWHDMTHILGGYDTDAVGEVKINAFQCGFRREDPFFWMFTSQLHFHLGVRMSPYAPAERWLFDPAEMVRALRRGMAVNTDLSDHWDWRAVLHEPVEALLLRYNVLPESQFAL